MEEEYLPIEPRVFDNGTKAMIYSFDELTVEQVEFANEVLDWKMQQRNKPADSFHEISRSGGAEWLTMVASYLVVPYVDGKHGEFDIGVVHEYASFLRKLKGPQQRSAILEVVNDFFTRTGRLRDLTMILQPGSKLNAKEILSEAIAISMMRQQQMPLEES
ncbi:MAG: hypothetical protein JSS89_13365 [Bacteroidetes bacterium]|nr:hypothetical protein [Bacteroidota bacterium]